MKKFDHRLLLNNIRSSYNIGSIFRTADAVGISHVYLSGITPAPKDRFNRPNKEIAKTALGAEKSILWEESDSPLKIINSLKKQGFTIVSIEQSKKSVDYKKIKKQEKILFIVGNEVDGIPKNILNKSDYIAEIEMMGEKESLNVAVAFGVVVFRILGI